MVLCKIDKVLSLLAKVEGAWDLALSCLQSEYSIIFGFKLFCQNLSANCSQG